MKRDKHKSKDKFLRRTYKTAIKAQERAREVEYVDLEEPLFSGWEVYIDIHPYLRMSEHKMSILKAIVATLNHKGRWTTRRPTIVRAMRIHKFNPNEVFFKLFNVKKNYRHGVYYSWYWRSISEKRFKSLPDYIQSYFKKLQIRPFGDRYVVDLLSLGHSHNPNDYVIARIRKTYFTKRAIPNSEAQREESYYDAILQQEQFFRKYYPYNYYSKRWDPQLFSAVHRNKWKAALKNLRGIDPHDYYPQSDIMSEDYIEPPSFSEVEEYFFKRHKVFSHKV